MPTPSLSATSPLGMVPSAPVGGTGIPLGATEIASAGVSPMPISSTGIIGSTVCSTIGTAPSTMFGSAASLSTAAACRSAPSIAERNVDAGNGDDISHVVIGHSADIGPD